MEHQNIKIFIVIGILVLFVVFLIALFVWVQIELHKAKKRKLIWKPYSFNNMITDEHHINTAEEEA